jgi:hypothetical protein
VHWDDPVCERPVSFKIRSYFNRDNHTVSSYSFVGLVWAVYFLDVALSNLHSFSGR